MCIQNGIITLIHDYQAMHRTVKNTAYRARNEILLSSTTEVSTEIKKSWCRHTAYYAVHIETY